VSKKGFHIIIPARYQSSRLPGKLLMRLGEQSVLERVYHQALLTQPDSIVIATDHPLIAEHANQFADNVVMTSVDHPTGTDRLAEVISKGNYQADDIIVNVQGDEPFIEPALINQVASSLIDPAVSIATLCWPLDNAEQLHNPNVVKVVRDRFNNALYFSRSAIPAWRDKPDCIEQVFRHIGLYAYRASFLVEFVSWPPAVLEQCEALEQLRALVAGYKIRVEQACVMPKQDINTKMDLLIAVQTFYKSSLTVD